MTTGVFSKIIYEDKTIIKPEISSMVEFFATTKPSTVISVEDPITSVRMIYMLGQVRIKVIYIFKGFLKERNW